MSLRYEYLVVPVTCWLLAQGVKYGLTLRKDGIQLRDLYASGGFPSSHTSFVTGLAMIIGLRLGFDSVEFSLGASFAAVVMYDALAVRRTTGQQTAAIKELAANTKNKLKSKMGGAKGHTPLEVIGGLVLGVLVALTLYAVDVNYIG